MSRELTLLEHVILSQTILTLLYKVVSSDCLGMIDKKCTSSCKNAFGCPNCHDKKSPINHHWFSVPGRESKKILFLDYHQPQCTEEELRNS